RPVHQSRRLRFVIKSLYARLVKTGCASEGAGTPSASSARAPPGAPESLLPIEIQCISRTAHGADRICMARQVQGPAQPADSHIDCAEVDLRIPAPDAVEQLVTAPHSSGPFHEDGEQAVLGRAELQHPADRKSDGEGKASIDE